MACATCNTTAPIDLTIFGKVEQDDSEYYIEPQRSAWSIITPVSGSALTNLWENPSFEDGSLSATANGHNGQWQNSALTSTGLSVATNYASSGTNSLLFDRFIRFSYPWINTTPGAAQLLPRTTGVTYCVSMWVKTCCGKKIKIGVRETTGIWYASTELTGTGCWQIAEFCISATAGESFPAGTIVAGKFDSFLTIEPDPTCATNYVDGITIVASESAVTPFDGDSVNGYWTGTPHASTSVMSAFSRTIGVKTPLSDFDFKVIAYSGHGLPPVVQPSTQYARRSGASVQQARANVRTVTITGEMCGDSWKDLAQKKEALINALGINLSGDCNSSREIYLSYECVDDCGDIYAGLDLRLRVNYNSGLEGTKSKPYCERITLSFIANTDPSYQEARQYCKQLTPGVAVTVNNCGNDYASVRLFGYNNGGLNIQSLQNQTTGKQVTFGVTGVGAGTTGPGNHLIFTNSPGNTSFVVVNGATKTDASNQMNVSSTSKPTQFLLAPGSNTILLTGTVSGAGSRWVICWRNRFLSATASCGDCECAQP